MVGYSGRSWCILSNYRRGLLFFGISLGRGSSASHPGCPWPGDLVGAAPVLRSGPWVLVGRARALVQILSRRHDVGCGPGHPAARLVSLGIWVLRRWARGPGALSPLSPGLLLDGLGLGLGQVGRVDRRWPAIPAR